MVTSTTTWSSGGFLGFLVQYIIPRLETGIFVSQGLTSKCIFKMLQWMGGSRRKVTTSRMSMQKRQKQYFEQRKKQQQYRPQSDGLEDHTDGIDMVGKHLKEHRSLDVLGLLNLSAIAHECKSACPSGMDDAVVSASTIEHDSIMDLPEVLPSSFAPANSVGYEEARFSSGLEAEAASPKKVSSSAPDNQNNGLGGIYSKPGWGKTAAEQRFSVFDLLEDDGLDGNEEDNPGHEAHVAFSIEGLGKVGTETPVCSPQRPRRTFSYGFPSPLKAKQQPKSSKNLNTLREDLEFEGDKLMLDVIDPYNGSSSEFSNCLISQKQKSFTDRDGRTNDGLTSRVNGYFNGRNIVDEDKNRDEDKWDGTFGSSSQDTSLFDKGEHDVPWKSCQRRIHGDSALNYLYENERKSEGISEGPWLPLRRTGAKATDMFDIQEPTTSSSMWQASEFMHEFPISNRTRQPTGRSGFNFRSLASEPDMFCFVSDDARDDLSMQSQESCSSSAVRGQGDDNSLINLKSRQSRNHYDVFADSWDKSGLKKTYRKETRHESEDDILLGNTTRHSKKCESLCYRSKSKSSCHPDSLFGEELGRKDISYFEEGSREEDTNPDSITFQKSLGMKHPSFGSKIWNEDHFSAFADERLHFGQSSAYDQSELCEPVEFSTTESYISKKLAVHDSSAFTAPDFHTHYEGRSKRPDTPHVACSCSETPSSDTSAQESFSKDVEYRAKSQPPNSKKYQPGEEICNDSGGIFFENKGVKNDSNMKDNHHESMGMYDTTSPLMESVKRKTSLPDHTEERPRSSGNPDRYENLYNEKDDDYHDELLTCQDWEKEDFSSKGKKSANTDKTDHVYTPGQVMMFQSYVFQLLCVQNVLDKSST